MLYLLLRFIVQDPTLKTRVGQAGEGHRASVPSQLLGVFTQLHGSSPHPVVYGFYRGAVTWPWLIKSLTIGD